MSYAVEILRSAQKELARIEIRERTLIVEAIRGLSGNPHPQGSKKLTGRPAWRIRVGDYRVIYERHEDRLVILVVAIGHRREIYR